jgi:hypothetical protein
MATQLLALTPAALTDSSYGFFKTFPRELRDAVYDLLYQEVITNVEGLRFHTRAVFVELRLVSRQFQLEYDERSAADEHNNFLTITDDDEFRLSLWEGGAPSGVPMYCPALATRSTSLTLKLIACMGDHEDYPLRDADIEWHITWIESLLQSLPHLRSIRVRLDLVSTLCISTVLKRARLVEALPKFAGLKIVGVGSLQSVGKADDAAPLAIWTKQHVLQEDYEAIELYRKRQADSAASV